MKVSDNFKAYLKRFSRPTPFERNYLFKADVRSGFYLSLIVMGLEIWMIISAIMIKKVDGEVRDIVWFVKHVGAYVSILIIAILNFIYSILYLREKINNKLLGNVLKSVFALASFAFALYISSIGSDKSGITFAFMTMGIYIITIYVWYPMTTLTLCTATFVIFAIIQVNRGNMTYSMQINAFTAYLVLLISGINIYVQRKIEASKEEELWKTYDLLREKNIHDEVTGLHNMSYFNHNAETILKNPYTDYSQLCFAYMDIENFKNFNEKYGFKKGNEFLIQISKVIGATFDDSLLARLSDDHFVVLTRFDGIEKKMAYIREMLREQEESVRLGLKVGLYRPKSADTHSTLACDYARYACNSIKKKYHKDIIEFDDKMSDELKKKQYVINNIERAIENKYIKVFYQPVIWSKNSRLSGSEALARWEDPEYGMLSPGVFIPVLEEYNLIHKLDLFVMETVCQDIAEFREKYGYEIPVSINLSRLDFDVADPIAELERCIQTYGIGKNKIHFEITESALSDNDTKFKDALETIRSKGYSLWLDDFGSGYSGLNVLKDFNFDTMKIDMKFIQRFAENEKTQPILESIVELAKKIGMNTLTEGVETEEVFKFLKSIGCQRIQGYLFGKPMPKEEFTKNIEAGLYAISEQDMVD